MNGWKGKKGPVTLQEGSSGRNPVFPQTRINDLQRLATGRAPGMNPIESEFLLAIRANNEWRFHVFHPKMFLVL
jgi:hypothetical protein